MTAYTVRDAKIEDAQRILEIYAYYVENTAITFEYDVPSKEELQRAHEEDYAEVSVSCH